jgi:hypothetical protein
MITAFIAFCIVTVASFFILWKELQAQREQLLKEQSRIDYLYAELGEAKGRVAALMLRTSTTHFKAAMPIPEPEQPDPPQHPTDAFMARLAADNAKRKQ